MLRAYLDLFEVTPVEKADVSEIGKWLQNKQPVYFNDVYAFRGVGNLWATRDRIAAALHRKKEELCETLVQAIEHPVPCEKAENAPVLKNLRDIDLKTIPIPSAEDSFSLAGVVIAEYNRKRIMRFHPFTRLKKDEIVIQVPPQVSKYLCPDLPVAICGGVCPSILLASMFCQYENELEIASALRCMTLGEPVYIAEIEGLHIPAFSEFVLLGKTTERVKGPSKVSKIYDSVKELVVHIDKIYHADDSLMHFLLPGGREHNLLMRMAGESALCKAV